MATVAEGSAVAARAAEGSAVAEAREREWRLSASLLRWLTAAALPHTPLSFALPFESAQSMATPYAVRLSPSTRAGVDLFCH